MHLGVPPCALPSTSIRTPYPALFVALLSVVACICICIPPPSISPPYLTCTRPLAALGYPLRRLLTAWLANTSY